MPYSIFDIRLLFVLLIAFVLYQPEWVFASCAQSKCAAVKFTVTRCTKITFEDPDFPDPKQRKFEVVRIAAFNASVKEVPCLDPERKLVQYPSSSTWPKEITGFCDKHFYRSADYLEHCRKSIGKELTLYIDHPICCDTYPKSTRCEIPYLLSEIPSEIGNHKTFESTDYTMCIKR